MTCFTHCIFNTQQSLSTKLGEEGSQFRQLCLELRYNGNEKIAINNTLKYFKHPKNYVCLFLFKTPTCCFGWGLGRPNKFNGPFRKEFSISANTTVQVVISFYQSSPPKQNIFFSEHLDHWNVLYKSYSSQYSMTTLLRN